MGKYTEPAMFVNKQFEALNKGLTDMYSNIAKNADAIRKRELAKKQQSAKQIRDWVKVYEKGTQENYQGALDFTAGQPKDDNMKKFTDNLKSTYKQGYDNIARMVASGASEGEIASYVQDQINAANTFTEGIVAFDAYSTQYNAGVQKIGKEPGKYKGNQVGDVVVGSQYNNIFTSTGTKVGEKINIDKLKMSGNLSQGIQFYYDDNNSGDIDEGEVLDLNTMAKNYGGGKNPYFKEVEDFTEITKAYKAQIDNLEKAPSFVTETLVTDEKGQTRKVQHVDRKKRQEFFMDPNTEGGKLIEEIIRSKDLTMLAQSVGGFDFAQKFDGDDPVMMEMLKIGLIEKLAPTLFPGSEKLGPSSLGSTTTSKQFEDRDPEIEVIENFTRPIHEDVSGYAVNNSPRKLQDLNTKYAGRPFKTSKGNSYTTGIVDDISVVPGQSNQNLLQINYVVNGNTSVGMQFDLNTPEGMKAFETALVHGNFPNAKKERIDGTYDGLLSGTPYDDSKNTTRITNRSGKPSMGIDDFNEQIKGTNEVIKFNDLYDSWESDWAGANPSASASGGSNVVSSASGGGNIVTLPGVNQNQQGGGNTAAPNTGTNYVGGMENPDSSIGGSVFAFSSNDGSSLNFKSSDAASTLLEEKNDGKNKLRIIGNFEALAGNSSGKGLANYGMGNEYIDKVKAAGFDPSTEKGFMYALESIAFPEALNEMGITEDQFENAFVSNGLVNVNKDMVKASLIDWEYNTGRDVGDLIHIAQMMKMEKLDSNGKPTGKYKWEDKIDLGGTTLSALVNANASDPVSVTIDGTEYKTAGEAIAAIKADGSPIEVDLNLLTPKEIANAKHAIMGDKNSRKQTSIDAYNKTHKYRINQFI